MHGSDNALTQRGVNAVRDGTQHVRDTALRASDSTDPSARSSSAPTTS